MTKTNDEIDRRTSKRTPMPAIVSCTSMTIVLRLPRRPPLFGCARAESQANVYYCDADGKSRQKKEVVDWVRNH